MPGDGDVVSANQARKKKKKKRRCGAAQRKRRMKEPRSGVAPGHATETGVALPKGPALECARRPSAGAAKAAAGGDCCATGRGPERDGALHPAQALRAGHNKFAHPRGHGFGPIWLHSYVAGVAAMYAIRDAWRMEFEVQPKEEGGGGEPAVFCRPAERFVLKCSVCRATAVLQASGGRWQLTHQEHAAGSRHMCSRTGKAHAPGLMSRRKLRNMETRRMAQADKALLQGQWREGSVPLQPELVASGVEVDSSGSTTAVLYSAEPNSASPLHAEVRAHGARCELQRLHVGRVDPKMKVFTMPLRVAERMRRNHVPYYNGTSLPAAPAERKAAGAAAIAAAEAAGAYPRRKRGWAQADTAARGRRQKRRLARMRGKGSEPSLPPPVKRVPVRNQPAEARKARQRAYRNQYCKQRRILLQGKGPSWVAARWAAYLGGLAPQMYDCTGHSAVVLGYRPEEVAAVEDAKFESDCARLAAACGAAAAPARPRVSCKWASSSSSGGGESSSGDSSGGDSSSNSSSSSSSSSSSGSVGSGSARGIRGRRVGARGSASGAGRDSASGARQRVRMSVLAAVGQARHPAVVAAAIRDGMTALFQQGCWAKCPAHFDGQFYMAGRTSPDCVKDAAIGYADQRKYEAAAATEDAATEPERLIETMCRTVWGAAVEVFPFLEECRDVFLSPVGKGVCYDGTMTMQVSVTRNCGVGLHADKEDGPFSIMVWCNQGPGRLNGGAFCMPGVGLKVIPTGLTIAVLAAGTVIHGTLPVVAVPGGADAGAAQAPAACASLSPQQFQAPGPARFGFSHFMRPRYLQSVASMAAGAGSLYGLWALQRDRTKQILQVAMERQRLTAARRRRDLSLAEEARLEDAAAAVPRMRDALQVQFGELRQRGEGASAFNTPLFAKWPPRWLAQSLLWKATTLPAPAEAAGRPNTGKQNTGKRGRDRGAAAATTAAPALEI
ncbi:hypothetical protein CHLRE_02g141466v5 [Chlamydomonas reinhardtii]|uniref:Uncharacterized protein n=1 Tax=Chlamydomonas reinhardtii TaxID=3055 RepID=A0A2K3E4B0_CHLRE|nr:uncharacterized protein CHLRE_02g141466v5 [Chlamydomonas reinhardtii]PNW87603.1 hypothetical protein CHLRE_02g141466v5 [Chlamydomonas reinhardtii]